MRVFVQPSGRRVEPFGDAPDDIPIQNRPLSAWRTEAFRDAGLVPIDQLAPPCLSISDTLFTTGGVLRQFVDRAAGNNAVLVLEKSLVADYIEPIQPNVTRIETGLRFDEVRFESGGDEPRTEIVIDPEEKAVEIPTPAYYMGTDKLELGFARHPVMEVHHWVHVMWANQLAGPIEALATPKWRWVARFAWAVLRARSFNRWRVLSKLNRIGNNCDIHPTAVIEGSTIGNNVSIGAYARVLFSTVGDGTHIMPGAQVEMTTLGEKVIVSQQVCLRFCVLYPEAVASQYLMQACVLGRQCITTGGSFSMDLNFERPVRVMFEGRPVSTGQRLIGSAFGHHSRIGTGFWLASGRMIPNDTFVIREPSKVVARITSDLTGRGPLVNDRGTLRPLEDVDEQTSAGGMVAAEIEARRATKH